MEDIKKKEKEEKEKEEKEEKELNELKGQKITIVYLNNTIDDFELPVYFEDFRTQVKRLFQINNKTEEILVVYSTMIKNEKKKDIEKIFEIKRIDEYKELLKKIKSNEVKDDKIYIETDRVPDGISRETPQTFEEEVKCLIETHLKAATERIKKGLSGRDALYPSSKKSKIKICSKCGRCIIGNIYRIVNDTEQKIYCTKCSSENNLPMFIIK